MKNKLETISNLFDGKEVKMTIKVGDRVVCSKYAGTEIDVDGNKYLIMRQNDILAIITE